MQKVSFYITSPPKIILPSSGIKMESNLTDALEKFILQLESGYLSLAGSVVGVFERLTSLPKSLAISILYQVYCFIWLTWYVVEMLFNVGVMLVVYWVVVNLLERATGLVSKLEESTGYKLILKFHHPFIIYAFFCSCWNFTYSYVIGSFGNMAARMFDSTVYGVAARFASYLGDDGYGDYLPNPLTKFFNGILSTITEASESYKPSMHLGYKEWDYYEGKKRWLIESVSKTITKRNIIIRNKEYTMLSNGLRFSLLDEFDNKVVEDNGTHYDRKQYYIYAELEKTSLSLISTGAYHINLSCKDLNSIPSLLNDQFESYTLCKKASFSQIPYLTKDKSFRTIQELKDYVIKISPKARRTQAPIFKFLDVDDEVSLIKRIQ